MKRRSSPLLSTGMPVYNGLPFLEETLRATIAGEFEDWELIVCDNASTDGTGDLVRSYAARDRRIRYVRNECNIGAARNYNRSFELARGRYFRWIASDDLHSPGAVARCVAVLEREPSAVLAFPETRLIDDAGNLLRDYDDGDGWAAASPADRFWNSVTRMGLSNAMFGVIRTDVLRRSTLQGDYPSSDLVMQTDLAIRGPFARVRGEYYFRRMHAGCTDSLDPLALAQFYNPGSSHVFEARVLRLFRELAGVVRRAPVPGPEKARMWALLARRANWERHTLSRELVALLRSTLRHASPALATRHA